VRGIPPELADEDDEDSEMRPRASFVEVLVPPRGDPAALEKLCHDLVDILPVRSGYASFHAVVHDEDAEPDPYATLLAWCRRFFGLEVAYIDGWLGAARRRHRGAGWLTVLGSPFVEAFRNAGGLRFDATTDITWHVGKNGITLRAGAKPSLGDIARGEFPVAIAEVARAIEPVCLGRYTKRGLFSMGGNLFSTLTDELPGAFADERATRAHLRRFLEPERLTRSSKARPRKRARRRPSRA
jgi:hypothetical protein